LSKENTLANETKKMETLEEIELQVIRFDENDVVTTSGTPCDCLAAGTRITTADGSLKNIEDIREGDVILAFDHEKGCYTGSEVLYAYQGESPKCAFTLRFDNGAALSIVGEHDLFEQESRKYVTLTEETAEQFVGRHFYSAADRGYTELLSVNREAEAVDYYELYTAKTINMVANGMLNVADDVDFLLNLYEFDEHLKADEKVLAEDLRTFGTTVFSPEYGFSKQEFNFWNMRYIKIAVGKGLTTWDALWKQHRDYLDQRCGRENYECA